MELRTYASREEKFKNWQNILNQYADKRKPELSIALSTKLEVKLLNNEVPAAKLVLFTSEAAEKTYKYLEYYLKGF
jgi:hypothetical protein